MPARKAAPDAGRPRSIERIEQRALINLLNRGRARRGNAQLRVGPAVAERSVKRGGA
jgi:hypothetical protein